MTMTVNILSQHLIKPSKPTPPHLRTYNISLVDESNPSVHIMRILFFPHSELMNHSFLEHSLSQVLPLFYPLAGRYNKQTHSVDCNDEGAEYSVARVVGLQLRQLIGAESEQLNHLLPLDVCAADEPIDPMLAVRVNEFLCGGLAIGVCASHRIFDNSSLGIFLSAWARAAATGGEDIVLLPYIDSSNIHFPYENMPAMQFEVSRTRDKSIVSKRFVFGKDAISTLRERVTGREEWKALSVERPPSRVVVVSAVLTRALLRADRARNGGKSSCPTLLTQWIDVRGRTVPPVARHSCGTWVGLATLEMDETETEGMERDFVSMAVKMRELTVRGVKDCARILSDNKFGRWFLVDSCIDACEKDERQECKVVWLTDLSKVGEYELDFGFGKPEWVSLADVPLKDLCMLMNTKDNDGIEAWVYLHESDMPFFQQDQDLQSLTTTTTTVAAAYDV